MNNKKRVNETKTRTLNESAIRKIVSETLRRLIKEYGDDELGDDYVDHDEWRSEEPSENEVMQILQQIQKKCNECGATFKNLGENEFGVISKNGNCSEVGNLLQYLEQNRIINRTGGHISINNPWHVKYRVISGMKLNKPSINEIGDTPKGQYKLGRLDARYIKKMLRSNDDEEQHRLLKKADDINDYAESQIHPEKYDGVEDEEELYSLPKAYKLGYKDELGGKTASDRLLDFFGYENRANNPEKESEFRKKHLKGTSIV